MPILTRPAIEVIKYNLKKTEAKDFDLQDTMSTVENFIEKAHDKNATVTKRERYTALGYILGIIKGKLLDEDIPIEEYCEEFDINSEQLNALLENLKILDDINEIDEDGTIVKKEVVKPQEEIIIPIKNEEPKKETIIEKKDDVINTEKKDDVINTDKKDDINIFVAPQVETVPFMETHKMQYDGSRMLFSPMVVENAIIESSEMANNAEAGEFQYEKAEEILDDVDDDDGLVDGNDAQRSMACKRLQVYFFLEERSEERSWGEVFKHPFKTFKEWKQKKRAKDALLKSGLTEENIKELMSYKRDGEIPENFKGFNEFIRPSVKKSDAVSKKGQPSKGLDGLKEDVEGLNKSTMSTGKQKNKEIDAVDKAKGLNG